MLALLVLAAGFVTGAGIVVQLAHQRHQLAEAAAARETVDFIGGRGDRPDGVFSLAMNDFHDRKKDIVLHAAQLAEV